MPGGEARRVLVARRAESIADTVEDWLRKGIVAGSLVGDDWLRESEVAEVMGVSRTPVRVAFDRLIREGLLKRAANGGVFVATLTIDDILAVYAVRSALEGMASALAAQHSNPELTLSLERIHTQMIELAGNGEWGGMATRNLEFHKAIRSAANNVYLDRFLGEVEQAVRRFGRSTYEVPGRAQQALTEHESILAAIRAQDPAEAQRAAARHMDAARDVRLEASKLRVSSREPTVLAARGGLKGKKL